MPPPNVAIVIVAWNQIDDTLACLETVYSQAFEDYEVILVDNGSADRFQAEIKAVFPQVTLLHSPTNLGFAGGNNIGIRYALDQGFKTIFLLNNDTLIDEHCLGNLVSALEKAQEPVMSVTAKIFYADDRERIWSVGSNFRPLLLEVNDVGKNSIDQGQWEDAREIEFAPFCGILFKAEVFEQVGLLDDRYFLYYEDMDYCQRIMRRGHKIEYVPEAVIWHAVSASSGGNQSPKALYWLARSSGRYFRTHGRGWRLFLIVPFRFAAAIKKTITLLGKSQIEGVRRYWEGLLHGWFRDSRVI